MTKLLDDILREPGELAACLDRLISSQEVARAAALIMPDQTAYFVGIGSSANAALAIAGQFNQSGIHAIAADASELLYFGSVPRGAVVFLLSRSGRSIEILKLLAHLKAAAIPVIAITNTPGTPLTQAAEIVIYLGARFDHLISVSMYSALVLAGAVVYASANGTDLSSWGNQMQAAFRATALQIEHWRRELECAGWLSPSEPTYFLARGPSVGNCNEARLLWEEAAKASGAALSTGSFRHGSQEIVRPGVRIAMWIHPRVLRAEDLQLATDLAAAGARLLLLGKALPPSPGVVTFELPDTPPGCEHLIDIVPLQLAAERLSRMRGQDCDTFRYCPYIIESEGGLTGIALE